MKRYSALERSIRLLFLAGILAAGLSAADYFVAVDGSAAGTGSIDSPLTLAKALGNAAFIQPGDTIWLREGVYNGAFTSRLKGARDFPIVVRSVPGERVILDGNGIGWQKSVLRIEGSWTWFRDFEITNSNSYNFGSARSRSMEVFGPNTRLINLVIHGTGQGPGFWTPAVDSEIYGCIIFNNGWLAADRGHGHGIYTQNDTGLKQIRDSIVFDQFGYNFHAFGSSDARLRHYLITGNVFFNETFLVGGNTPAEDIQIDENYFYRSRVDLGYGNPNNKNLTFTNNLVATRISGRWWENARIQRNTVIPVDQAADTPAVGLYLRQGGTNADFVVDGNTYYRGPARDGVDFYLNPGTQGRSMRFPGWQSLGYDAGGTYRDTEHPAENHIVLRQNAYDSNRAHLIVYNWLRQDEVQVDLSSLKYEPGDEYELRNVRNYFEEAITGKYDGTPINLPMNTWTSGEPVMMKYPATGEMRRIVRPDTFPTFGVFVVTRRPAAAASAARYTPAARRRVR